MQFKKSQEEYNNKKMSKHEKVLKISLY